MNITLKLKTTENKEWAKIKRSLKSFNELRAKVGVIGEQASIDRGKITMAEVAATQELGSPRNGIPARPFLASTISANKDAHAQLIEDELRRLLEGKGNARRVLSAWGAKAASDVRARLLRGTPLSPPLSKTTLEERKKNAATRARTKGGKLRTSDGRFFSLKGVGTRPLVETGQLAASISWEVSANPEGVTP